MTQKNKKFNGRNRVKWFAGGILAFLLAAAVQTKLQLSDKKIKSNSGCNLNKVVYK
ncbi:hypothetical protein [Fangia hongkongensis]|uniref:hypothetical protein n=1 Tax=Fangia hongkongensis TaxID=270495 RepID=UPI001908ACFA|nr:hypothetical protein [Fangia hongkongensis]